MRAALRRWHHPELIETAELLLAERVTNELRHGRTDVGVRVHLHEGLCVIAVADGTSAHPTLRCAGLDDEDGRGLLLVDSLAEQWGVSPDGTTTWCSLPLSEGPSAMDGPGHDASRAGAAVSALAAPAPTSAAMMNHLVQSAGLAREPAADMTDLTDVIRTLLAVEARRDTRVRLGGNLFDVVITSCGEEARAVVAQMDEQQNGCGPVIEDPETGWLYWLVPPGTCGRWDPHEHAVCLGAPHTITLPSLSRSAPPGPYWLRPSASDRLVPPEPLRRAIARFRPEPAPHTALAAQLGFTH